MQLHDSYVFVSFSSTLRAFMQGIIDEEDVLQSPKLVFGCSRNHIFPEETNRVPKEVSWCHRDVVPDGERGRYKAWYGQLPHGSTIPSALVHPKVKDAWDRLKSVLRVKAEQDQIIWQASTDYRAIIKAETENGRPCFFRRRPIHLPQEI